MTHQNLRIASHMLGRLEPSKHTYDGKNRLIIFCKIILLFEIDDSWESTLRFLSVYKAELIIF